MMRCAIYARYSTDMERATSIDDQVAVARRYAEQRGWQVLRGQVYKDEAVSGATLDGRDGVQALMAAAAKQPRPFDVLLVDDSSRVARDLADAVRFMQLLRFHGVRVLYLSQQIDSGDEQAETTVAVPGIVDGLYLREASKKIRRALVGQLERGLATGGKTFGYRSIPLSDPSGRVDSYGQRIRVSCELAKDDVEAETVHRIFERSAAGTGIGTIAEDLNRSATPGPRGHLWKYNSVSRVLRNERYRGVRVWGQKRIQRRPGTRSTVQRRVPRDEWHTRERPELRIVSDELWRQVQVRHLFSGLMRCAVCGKAVGAVTGGAGSPRHGCTYSWRNGLATCTNRLSVRAKIADAALLSRLQEELQHPDTVAYVTEALSARIAVALDDGSRRRQRLEGERTRVQKKLDNLIAVLENDGPAPTVRQAIRAREAELARLQRDLEAIREPLGEKLAVLPSWVEGQLGNLADLLNQAPDRVRHHLNQTGVRFIVSPVSDKGRSFLRAAGSAILLGGLFNREVDLSASDASHPRSSGSSTWTFTVDLPPNQLGPGWRRKAG